MMISLLNIRAKTIIPLGLFVLWNRLFSQFSKYLSNYGLYLYVQTYLYLCRFFGSDPITSQNFQFSFSPLLFLIIQYATSRLVVDRFPNGFYRNITQVQLTSLDCRIYQFYYDCILYIRYRELEELCEVRSKTERAARLMTLMNDHWFLDDYVETMVETFGLEIVFITIDIYLQMLLFVYMMIWDFGILGFYNKSQSPYISGIIELNMIIGKLIYLCYRCDYTIEEVIFKYTYN